MSNFMPTETDSASDEVQPAERADLVPSRRDSARRRSCSMCPCCSAGREPGRGRGRPAVRPRRASRTISTAISRGGLGLTSNFGAFLDPVADKLIVSTALVLLVQAAAIASASLAAPLVAAAVIIGREITVSALREWMCADRRSARTWPSTTSASGRRRCRSSASASCCTASRCSRCRIYRDRRVAALRRGRAHALVDDRLPASRVAGDASPRLT